ncbi:hypothetical protein [Rathayibacter tanaceti]|uniref:Uncharacterized protein n=2 Tax=Rathayibacter tanaceti TaxID=1671680 RepID=A0A162J1K9_9MICO|nr:hypothetical protein [Rathayibacter tanaceti]KZX20857.1 hypothetical protein ACH61_02028 [Rathayibacter tanaceti]QHC54972.1 hypothetical protein GSU10_04475 [Rathayibacter tanaceti]TCO38517.1 hypothetical protein EV639_102160 [Rathayibacter tanaceti]
MTHAAPTSTDPLLRRRTALAAAWTLPVIALATATPAAAASAAARFDLQMQNFSGDDGSWYNDDRTQYLRYNSFFSPTVRNAGPDAAPAGTVVVMRSDDRVLGSPSLRVADGSDIPASAIAISGPVVEGNRSTFTAVISVPIPAGATVLFSPRFDRVLTQEDASAIHDLRAAFPDLTPHSFSLSSPAGADADPSNDSISWSAEVGTVVPWNGAISAEWASLTTGSCTYPSVSALVVTSTGANAVPTGTQVYYSFDTRFVTAVSVASATIDGAPTTMRLGGVDTRSTSGFAYWFTTEPVAPGSVLRIELASVTDASATASSPVTTASGGLGTDVSQSDTSDDSFRREGTCA